MRRLLLLVLVLCCARCPAATIPLADPTLDEEAKQFHPPEGQGLLYVVRQPGTAILGGFVVFPVAVDGTALGAVAPGTYLVLPVTPGFHHVTALTIENSLRSADGTCRRWPGHFCPARLPDGWLGPRVALDIMDEAAGRKARPSRLPHGRRGWRGRDDGPGLLFQWGKPLGKYSAHTGASVAGTACRRIRSSS